MGVKSGEKMWYYIEVELYIDEEKRTARVRSSVKFGLFSFSISRIYYSVFCDKEKDELNKAFH